MKPEHYKSTRKGKLKLKSKLSGSKRRMLAEAKEWKPTTSPKLREAYSAEIERARAKS
jgi:hypothetical protein